MESAARSIVKAILWQATGLIVMLAVGYWLSGSIRLGGEMAVINTAIGLVNYLIYERIWSTVRWGRRMPATANRAQAQISERISGENIQQM